MTQVRPSDDDRAVLVLGPTPTPNGGMHLGHIAGPYLAADVYARYQRARGRDVVFTSGTDDDQTYVVASARRLGVSPEELCRTSTAQIRASLSAMGISVDGFSPFDDAYRATVVDFFGALHAAGKFRLRTVRLPYLERTGEFVVDGLVEGGCPVCLATSRGGLCETCGHPNDFDALLSPHSTVDPSEDATLRDATILVLPLEDYRARLTAYLEERAPQWRPHLVQMVREVLARPLHDVAITYPLDWGIPAPFPETPGQVLNAWLELVPSSLFTSSYSAAFLGRETAPGDLWRVEQDMRVVPFLGFDYVYLWSLPNVALLMAAEGYVYPESLVTNEFYELESEKFSTSKGHVVSCEELLDDVPRDLVRLYLALTAPEFQRTTFSRAGLDKVTQGRLVQPWNRLAETLGKAVANAARADVALPVSVAGRARAATMLARFDVAYELPTYSLARAAETILVHVDRLGRRAAALDGGALDADPEAWGDLFVEVKALVAAASPILVDLAAAARRSGCFDGALDAGAFDVADVVPFAPPLLPCGPRASGAGLSGGA